MKTTEEKRIKNKEWRNKNREHVNEYDREYRKNHPVETKERAKRGQLRYKLKHPNAGKISRRKYIVNHTDRYLLDHAKQRARKSGLPFSLVISDIKIPEFCPHCQKKLKVGTHKDKRLSPSIDRIDSRKGYTKDNIIIVCWRANSLKKDATLDELKQLVDFYSKLESKDDKTE